MPSARSGGGPGRGRRRPGGGGHDAPVPGSSADDTPDADPASVARTIVLRKLTAAPRTRAQLADALTERGVPDDVSEATLDRFQELGLVDDQEFARQWARSRQAGRGLARRALAYELRQRGVEDEVVRNALDDPGLDDELETARALVRRRLAASGLAPSDPAASGPGGDRDRRIRRVLGLLARKGYSGAVAARAVREVLAELAADPDAVPAGLDD
ncbi:MAG TPA: regulatory protein RecX [Kineosporiaceae bacterium]|nr:regulatory protein RecX [Kineosporiaceae bacterium]